MNPLTDLHDRPFILQFIIGVMVRRHDLFGRVAVGSVPAPALTGENRNLLAQRGR